MIDIAAKTVRRLLFLIWIGAVVAIVALIAVAAVAPRVGLTPLAIRGGSMQPQIPVGSLAFATAVDPGLVSAGDVISFRSGRGTVTTHRVLGIVDQAGVVHFTTQGDANPTPDPTLVQGSAVIGRIDTHIPGLGYTYLYLSTTAGLVSVVSALATVLLAIWLLEDFERSRASSRARSAIARRPTVEMPAFPAN
jgi:signal peptidase